MERKQKAERVIKGVDREAGRQQDGDQEREEMEKNLPCKLLRD